MKPMQKYQRYNRIRAMKETIDFLSRMLSIWGGGDKEIIEGLEGKGYSSLGKSNPRYRAEFAKRTETKRQFYKVIKIGDVY